MLRCVGSSVFNPQRHCIASRDIVAYGVCMQHTSASIRLCSSCNCSSSARTRRGGSCLRVIQLYYKTFLIYRTCMRRAPARPVRACFVREWCTVPKIILHTSHLHFTLDTSSHLISSELFSPQIISSLPVCHLSSPQLFSSEHCSTFLISSKPFRKLLLSERSHLYTKNRCAQKAFAQRNFCTQKLETQMRLHGEAFYT